MTAVRMPDQDIDRTHVPFAITDRCLVPRERYFDKAFFDLENEKLWPHAWQMACRLEEIPNVGDFVEYSVAQYSVVVVRTRADEIKAYQNACRHRATQLAMGCGTFEGGKIVCPFHGWRWDLDGTPSLPLYGQDGFEPRCVESDDLRLVECQVGTWANCVFVNMDTHAPPLLEALDPMPGLLDPLNVDKMYVHWWRGARMKANWKIAMEAFMESWHVAQTHPQLTMGVGNRYPADRNAVYSQPNGHMYFVPVRGEKVQTTAGTLAGMNEADAAINFARLMCEGLDGGMVMPKDLHVIESLRNAEYEPGEFGATRMKALLEWNRGAGIPFPEPSPDVVSRAGGDFFMFPNMFILPTFGNALMYRSRPDTDDPEHCFFETWALTLYPEGYEPPKPTCREAPGDDLEWPLIPRQDFSNIERQQRGLHNPGFKGMRLASKYEDGIANMHAHLDAYLAR
jgi:nitrite reductase/ring-hydroxylating ferredoxin subunit